MVAKKESLTVYLFCWFIAATGCRISEALNITAQSIDFEAGLVIVESLKKRRTGVYRAVPLPATLLDALEKWIKSVAFQPHDRLWPWSRMTGYRRITEVMRKAQISGAWATPKGLRHAFGVRAVQSGAPLHMVQRWLGHADMKTTAIYASAVGPEEREIASRTWLGQDRRAQGQQPIRATPTGEPEYISSPFNEPVDTEQGPLSPVTKQRKSWAKRLFSAEEVIATCQMIHFYLFCSRNSADISNS